MRKAGGPGVFVKPLPVVTVEPRIGADPKKALRDLARGCPR